MDAVVAQNHYIYIAGGVGGDALGNQTPHQLEPLCSPLGEEGAGGVNFWIRCCCPYHNIDIAGGVGGDSREVLNSPSADTRIPIWLGKCQWSRTFGCSGCPPSAT